MKTTPILFAAALLSNTAFGNLQNGHFEDWTGNQPDGWTTIDSGISVQPDASTVYQGSLSAQVWVNTATQGNTDLRQTVSVSAGQPQTFSVWVRHTEGGIKARLYVDGYLSYSDPTLLNQWQQLSYTYQPASSGSIEVGLRFYDVSGFDGSELVWVDDYMPHNGGTGGGGTGGCASNGLTFNLTTDDYGSETSWQIDDGQAVVASGSGYGNNQTVEESLCLADGNYTLSVLDSYGDGICCSYGNGSYSLTHGSTVLASGGSFTSADITAFSLGGGGSTPPLDSYYQSAEGLSGYALKTQLATIIGNHTAQGYGALWTFYASHELDTTFEQDGSILDIYSENPIGSDPYVYTAVSDQCGTYNSEADCYNREHSFPRSWFGGAIEPMNSDVHHIFASDGYVNSKRSSFPYGLVGSATFTSMNGSRLGSAASGIGYSGTVFEPIDEYKGDLARAYFYMATRYQSQIGSWQNNSSYGDAVLNGSSDQVFENWFLTLLKQWHAQDPVSQKELDRNDAAHTFQGNRNPFVDHPEFVTQIWGN
ncbi:endonuclease [Aestuariibacter halophilus]|uniref:Endonuclease n=1 Tax=Fluctibacter halophilus TaxID=226011 RepID=A0ABS8G7Y6_9ALTE|nr:endonuclease [Aestuariibacter halophilus]MCC2616579.1 endonuclease [Aestuariibacter halophilus]